MKDSLWSADLFRCESLSLRSYWVLVILDQYTRRIVGFGIHAGTLDGIAVCRMFNAASGGSTPSRYLSTDHDPLFEFHRWKANLRVLEIEEIKTVPYTPISHPFVERLIGTIRREYFDQVPFWGATDLRRKLAEFQAFYNKYRVHAALDGETPDCRAGQPASTPLSLQHFGWQAHCRGLFQLPVAA
jgi:transposase InsO family protein